MICRTARNLMGPYVDGELDAGWIVQIEEHIADCARCRPELQQQRGLHASLANPALRFTAPASLRDAIVSAMQRAPDGGPSLETPAPSPVTATPTAPTAPTVLRFRRSTRWYALAAVVAVAAIGATLITVLLNSQKVSGPALADVIPAHIRSLQPEHTLTDVLSSDQHTVGPWFVGKIDFAPPVRDLAADGFPLVGGRLDYLRDRPAAALVYRRAQHAINLFITKADAGAAGTPPHSETLQGYNTVAWVHGGLAYTAASNLNAAELRAFADTYRAATGQ